MYFIFSFLGKQFVQKGPSGSIKVPKMNQNKKNDIKILFAKDDDGNCKIGKPCVEGNIDYSLLKDCVKGKKIEVFKKKRSKRFKKKQGHRQQYSTIAINSIKI